MPGVQDKEMITVGELFAGIGGIGLGLEMTGNFEVKWQVERDEYASKVLAKHWPDVVRWNDVVTFPPDNSDKWNVDLICGGFPCQDISTSGKQKGLEGARSGLFYEVVRIAQQLRPKYILLENVAALRVRGLDRILGSLAEIGYDSQWHSIPASAIGAPHRRDRVFIIGYARRNTFNQNTVSNEHNATRTEDGWVCTQCGIGVFDGCGCNHGEWQCQKCREWTYPFYYDRKDGCQHCGAIVADTSSERLQGQRQYFERLYSTSFQNWKVSLFKPNRFKEIWKVKPGLGRVVDGVSGGLDRSKRLKCLGNAVVPQVAQVIGEYIVYLDETLEMSVESNEL